MKSKSKLWSSSSTVLMVPEFNQKFKNKTHKQNQQKKRKENNQKQQHIQ